MHGGMCIIYKPYFRYLYNVESNIEEIWVYCFSNTDWIVYTCKPTLVSFLNSTSDFLSNDIFLAKFS